MSWLTTPSGTAHLVNEEATSWARTEKYGVFVFYCGYQSNINLVNDDNGEHCQRCEGVYDGQHKLKRV